MNNFHVGQKVVCIKASWRPAQGSMRAANAPHYGRVYEISGLDFDGDRLFLELVGCELHPELCTQSFEAGAFRPVIERKTDISIFTEILHRANSGAPLELVSDEASSVRRRVARALFACGESDPFVRLDCRAVETIPRPAILPCEAENSARPDTHEPPIQPGRL